MGIKNWLRRWLLGGNDNLEGALPIRDVENDEDTRFTITKAINGYVITSIKYTNMASARGQNSVTKKIYVVPQGESVINGISYLLASERLE
jgi:hypothetical protein